MNTDGKISYNESFEIGFTEPSLALSVPYLLQKDKQYDSGDRNEAVNYNKKVVVEQQIGGPLNKTDLRKYELSHRQCSSKGAGFRNSNNFGDKAQQNLGKYSLNYMNAESIGTTYDNDEYSRQTTMSVSSNNLRKRPQETPSENPDPSFLSKRATLNKHHQYNMAPVTNGVRLISVSEAFQSFDDKNLASVFDFNYFNSMQSLCFNEFFGTTANCVVSSPTGSGKTVLFELAILKLFQITGCFEKLFNAFTISDSSFKVVYIAPTKSLCVERAADWSRKFQILGLSCKALTGDTSLDELANDKRANIIVTTPEKWDFITRKWADNKLLIGCVKLFMIDEIHTLREGRGATLEVIVSRMKAMTQHDLRFVALSATVPNIGDIATWLTQDKYHPNSPATTRIFGDEFRPVKLCKFVYGYNNSNSGGNSYAKQFYMDKTFSKKLPELIKKHGESKPILIFCSTRNIAITTAKFLASYHNQTSISWRSRLWKRPDCNSFNFKNHELKSFAKDGVAFHHAGLDFQDRHMVEQGFIAKDLSIVCCTSTLAVGTNLPAHTVIIKGTKFWSGNDLREHNELEVIQMIGRAGRPQFDNIGTAIIMTTNDKRVLYESLVRGTQAIESCLHLNLMDHFVAEVSLGTIFSLKSAVVWLKSTFLYTRLRKNPAFYPNVISAKYKIKPDIDDKNIENFCEQLISDLIRDKLIKNLAQTDPIELVCTNFGTSMSQHYMKYETMKSIIEFNTKTNKRNYPLLINDILTFLSKSAEFKEFKLKHAEKKLYKDLNQAEGIRFPIKSAVIREDWQKISILIQTELGGVEYSHYEGARNNYLGYMCDKSMVIKHAERILRCLIDCFCQRSDSNSIKSALELYRSLQGRSWEDLPLILRQLEGIGPAFVQKFIAHNIQSFTDLRALENNRIESLLGINKDSSVKITEDLEGIPHFAIEAEQLGIFEFQSTRKFSSKDSYLKVTIKVKAQYLNSPTVPIWHQKRMNAIIITETSDGILLDFRRVPVARLKDSLEFEIKATIAYSSQAIESHIYCETVAGVSESYKLILDVTKSCILNDMKKNSVRTPEPFIQNIAVSTPKDNHSIENFKREGKVNKSNDSATKYNKPVCLEPENNKRQTTDEFEFGFDFDNSFDIIESKNIKPNFNEVSEFSSTVLIQKANRDIERLFNEQTNSPKCSKPHQLLDTKQNFNQICSGKSVYRSKYFNRKLDELLELNSEFLVSPKKVTASRQFKPKASIKKIDSSFEISNENSSSLNNDLSYQTDTDVDINTDTCPLFISTSTPLKKVNTPLNPIEFKAKLKKSSIKTIGYYNHVYSNSEAEPESNTELELNVGLE